MKHRLSFKVRAETFAMFRELQAGIREELGGGDVDDDLLFHEIMRRALSGGGVRSAGGSGEEGGEDVGRAPYQVAVSRCETCKLVSIDAAGESFPVDAVVEDMIGCDAQQIPHVGANKRATQTVAPAKRREVMRRERNCCAMPGCRNHRHLHVHHVKPRSEGGNHDPAFLVPLCHRHHSQVHDGTVVVTGNGDEGFVFRHADGARYGESPDAAAVELAQQAFAALSAMGFKMTEARKLIDRVQHAGQQSDPPNTLEAFVQAALRAT